VTSGWDPDRYLLFHDHRLRPAHDLLARVPDDDVSSMVDLGCGTGVAFAMLRTRYPRAEYLGVDLSTEMLERAASDHPDGEWLLADARVWRPHEPVDLIFSNAALHWLGNHAELMPELISCLAPGGSLAVQMPANFYQPTHTTIRELVDELDWSVNLRPLLPGNPVHPADFYHRVLSPVSQHLDIWTTTYHQPLAGEDPVTEWVYGTALGPLLGALNPAESKRFRSEYSARIRSAYPRRPDGITLLPFTRLFMVATRPL